MIFKHNMLLMIDIIAILNVSYQSSLFSFPTISVLWESIYQIDDENLIKFNDRIIYHSNSITIRSHNVLYNFHSNSGFTIKMILNYILEIFNRNPPQYYKGLLRYEWYFNGLSFNSYELCWDVIWTRKNTFIEDTDVAYELHKLFPTL